MDWLRSEDLKEEKVLTTSNHTIARQRPIYSFQIDLAGLRLKLVPIQSSWGLQSEGCVACSRESLTPAVCPQMQFPPGSAGLASGRVLSLLMFPFREPHSRH